MKCMVFCLYYTSIFFHLIFDFHYFSIFLGPSRFKFILNSARTLFEEHSLCIKGANNKRHIQS